MDAFDGDGSTRVFAGRANRFGTVQADFLMPKNSFGARQIKVSAITPLGPVEFAQPIQLVRRDRILLSTDKPLNPDEIAALRTWISEGAYWPDDSAKANQKPAPPAPKSPTSFGNNFGPGNQEKANPFQDGPSRPKKDSQASRAAAADAIRARRGVVVDLGADDARLSVDLSVIAPPSGDADLALLDNLRPTISWLNLSRTAITDAGLASLKGLPELERLRLEWTAIGDSGLDFAATCAKLSSLNLVGTKVTDAGLAKLAPCKSLRKLYLWKTGVSPDGVAKFKAARPEVEVVEGVQ